MAALTINVPNGDVINTVLPRLIDNLAQRGIVTEGMTTAQVGQRYIAEEFKDIYKQEKHKAALAAVAATISTADTTASTTADTIA